MKRFRHMCLSPDTGIGGGAEEVPPTDDKTEVKAPEQEKDGAKEKEQEKIYSEDDINKIKAAYEKKLEQSTACAAEEAAKKAVMKPEEKAEYEAEQKLLDIEKREKELAFNELKADTKTILAEHNLDAELLEYVIRSDKESTLESIKKLKPIIDKLVQRQVEERLPGKSPRAGSPQNSSDSVRDEIRKALGGV